MKKNNSSFVIGQQHLNASINELYNFEHDSYKIAGFEIQAYNDLGLDKFKTANTIITKHVCQRYEVHPEVRNKNC